MKKEKIIYWITTIIVAGMMMVSGFMYLSKNEQVMEGIKVVGMPYYFFQLLGVAKILGAIAILYPKFPTIREWAYAGFTFTFVGAIWVHISTTTSFVGPLICLFLLAISYQLKYVVSLNRKS